MSEKLGEATPLPDTELGILDAPELAGLAAALSDFSYQDPITDTPPDAYYQLPQILHVSRRQVRDNTRFDQAVPQLYALGYAAAGLAEKQLVGDKIDFYKQLFADQIRRRGGASDLAEAYGQFIASIALTADQNLANYRKLSAAITNDLLPQLITNQLDNVAQFQLLQALTETTPPRSDSERHKTSANFQHAAAFTTASGGPDVSQKLLAKLHNGDFDGWLARQILHEALPDEQPADKANKPISDLGKTALLISQATDNSPAITIDFLSQPERRWLWPDQPKKQLDQQHRRLATEGTAVRRRHDKQLSERGILAALSATSQTFDKNFQNFAATCLQAAGLSSPSAARTSHKRSHQPNQNSHRRRRQPAADRSTAAGAAAEIPAEHRINRLTCIDSQGQELAEDSPKFQKMIADYLAKHNNDPVLANDLKNMLDYLKHLDWSIPGRYGLKKYEGATRDQRYHNMLSFKPLDAVGLSTTSESAKKTRILFIRPPKTDPASDAADTIGILDIFDRDELNKTEIGLGMRTSARK
ncbi:MAG: hypothetical protein ACREGA_04445 [Candidatus Saccharimonadales bacterium]